MASSVPSSTLPSAGLFPLPPQQALIIAAYRSFMANAFETRPADTRGLLRFSLLLLLCLGSSGLQAEIISDLLIVLEPDGRHYVAQQTLATSGNLVVAELPAARISLDTRFSGPDRLTFASAHELHPNRISLWSGSAWTRYRHHYSQGLSEPDPGVFELDTGLEHADIQIDEPGDVQWSLTWILPGNAHLTDFHADAAPPSAITSPGGDSMIPAGRWQTSGQVLTFRQSGGRLPALSIRFSLDTAERMASDACLDATKVDGNCAPDSDSDEVPDFRDICLPPSSGVAALLPPDSIALQNSAEKQSQVLSDDLGCAHEDPLVLAGIQFQSGQSYLDVASRQVLDRVAHALQRMPENVFEISSHTDNAGRVENNQRLSEDRAKAVRHYLILRGVNAGQLKARGYGEILPAYNNVNAAGRRANRRTELRRLN